MRFSDNLRNLRLQRGLTQMKLAEGLQTTQSSITAWESERREPDFRTIQRIAEYFNVPLSALLPSDDSVDADFISVVAESIQQNEKLKELFNIVKGFSDQDLSALLAVARSISNKNV